MESDIVAMPGRAHRAPAVHKAPTVHKAGVTLRFIKEASVGAAEFQRSPIFCA